MAEIDMAPAPSAQEADKAFYKNLFSLKERVVIVTGGTGYLGRDICKGLACSGAQVVAIGRNPQRLEDLRAFNGPDIEGEIECFSCDVTNETQFAAVIHKAWQRYGRLDALINNAGSAKREKWEDLNKQSWLDGFEGTVNHYFTCTKIVSEYMLKNSCGSIVNNASLFSFLGHDPSMYLDLNNGPAAHHAAAKGAVLQLTRYLATLWANKGIRVNAVSPGFFPQKRGPERPDFMAEITRRIPMRRKGLPSDLAGTIIFLVSDASAYLTGQNIVVDGGYSVW